MRLGLGVMAGAIALALPNAVAAFCGFYVSGADAELYNNATMVVMMRDGTRTVLSMQNNYQGPAEDFAMVVPVPVVLQEDNVKTLPRDVFQRVDQLAAPRLVEYWEQDPCEPPRKYDRMRPSARRGGAPPPEPTAAAEELGVTIEAQFEVGEYQIVILSAKDSTGLDTWLKQEGYKIPEGSEPLLRPYVEAGSKFFVAKVDVEKVTMKDGQAMLSPLRFHYDSEEFSLPVRLGLVNSNGTQDLIVHILARGQRYEVANYDNVTIPTNINVDDSVREQFGAFYAALFDSTLEKNKGAVVTEYSWDASGCDPCPTPPLQPAELMTLGADVLAADGGGAAGALPAPGPPARRRKPVAGPPRRPPRSFVPRDFVLTRLHARYGADSLGEDLVFKAAAPIGGGREHRSGPEGVLEQGSAPAGRNAFQGRYAIRHEWTGPIECENPRRGIWGGPPPDVKRETSPRAAMDLAFAPRGTLKLAKVVKQDVPEIGVTMGAAAAPVATTSTADDTAAKTPPKKDAKSGCGCAAGGSAGGGTWMLALAGFAIGFAFSRRRR